MTGGSPPPTSRNKAAMSLSPPHCRIASHGRPAWLRLRATTKPRRVAPGALAICVLVGLVLVRGVRAEGTTAASAERSLSPVEVIGQTPLPGGVGQSRNEYPGNVQMENDSVIERARTDNLTDFMKRRLASVSVNDIQGSPFQADLSYRGHRLSPLLGSSQG